MTGYGATAGRLWTTYPAVPIWRQVIYISEYLRKRMAGKRFAAGCVQTLETDLVYAEMQALMSRWDKVIKCQWWLWKCCVYHLLLTWRLCLTLRIKFSALDCLFYFLKLSVIRSDTVSKNITKYFTRTCIHKSTFRVWWAKRHYRQTLSTGFEEINFFSVCWTVWFNIKGRSCLKWNISEFVIWFMVFTEVKIIVFWGWGCH
jgi:hypothetical protein